MLKTNRVNKMKEKKIRVFTLFCVLLNAWFHSIKQTKVSTLNANGYVTNKFSGKCNS